MNYSDKTKDRIQTFTWILTIIAGLLIVYPYIPFFLTDMTYVGMVSTYAWNWIGGIVFSLSAILLEWKYER